MVLIQAKCWKAMKTMKNWKKMLLEPNKLLWIAPLRWTSIAFSHTGGENFLKLQTENTGNFLSAKIKVFTSKCSAKIGLLSFNVYISDIMYETSTILQILQHTPCAIKLMPYWSTVDFLDVVVFKLKILVRNLKETQEYVNYQLLIGLLLCVLFWFLLTRLATERKQEEICWVFSLPPIKNNSLRRWMKSYTNLSKHFFTCPCSL